MDETIVVNPDLLQKYKVKMKPITGKDIKMIMYHNFYIIHHIAYTIVNSTILSFIPYMQYVTYYYVKSNKYNILCYNHHVINYVFISFIFNYFLMNQLGFTLIWNSQDTQSQSQVSLWLPNTTSSSSNRVSNLIIMILTMN